MTKADSTPDLDVYSDGTSIAAVSDTTTSFADVTVQPSTAYTYTVSATDAAGNASSQSASAGDITAAGTIGPDTTAPSVPAGLTGSAVADGRIDLSWSAPSDDVAVSGYNLYRDGARINTVPIGSASYSDTGLAPGVSHTWTVSALDAAGNESAQSSGWSGAAGSGAMVIGYSYDVENRLTTVTNGSQAIGSYAHDGLGDRVAKTVGAVTTAYTSDLATALPQILCESTGSSATYYVYAFSGGAGPLEIEINGTPYWYLTDSEGSVRLITDASGSSPSTYSYSAFGNVRIHTGSLANEILFAGQRTDAETGLQYLRARTYDPTSGTFLQRDSWGGIDQVSQSQNRYLYAQGDPTNRVDPSGRCDGSLIGMIGCGWDTLTQTGQNVVAGGQAVVGSAVSYGGGVVNTITSGASGAISWTKDRADSGIDSANRIWQDTGGALVNDISSAPTNGLNWLSQHPYLIVAGVVLGVACVAACPELLSGLLVFGNIEGAGGLFAATQLACMISCPAMATLGPPALAFGAELLHDTIAPDLDPGSVIVPYDPTMDAWNWSPYSADGKWNLRNPNGSGQFISGHDYAYPPNP